MIINNYKQPLLFYTLATIISWLFWFAAGYISHINTSDSMYMKIASVLGFIGLLSPVLVAYWLISTNAELKIDLQKIFFNFKSVKQSK